MRAIPPTLLQNCIFIHCSHEGPPFLKNPAEGDARKARASDMPDLFASQRDGPQIVRFKCGGLSNCLPGTIFQTERLGAKRDAPGVRKHSVDLLAPPPAGPKKFRKPKRVLNEAAGQQPHEESVRSESCQVWAPPPPDLGAREGLKKYGSVCF